MKFENVKIKHIGETVNGTSKAGNAYTLKTAVFEITPEGEEYPQSIAAKTMNASVIEKLERMAEGVRIASVNIDFEAREYGGRWYTDNKLWRIDEAPAITSETPTAKVAPAPAPKAQAPAPAHRSAAVDTLGQLFGAEPVSAPVAPVSDNDDLPF